MRERVKEAKKSLALWCCGVQILGEKWADDRRVFFLGEGHGSKNFREFIRILHRIYNDKCFQVLNPAMNTER